MNQPDPVTSNTTDEKDDRSVTQALASWIIQVPYGIAILLALALVAIVGSAYAAWWLALPSLLSWSNANALRWIVAWIPVFFLGFAPLYVGMAFSPVIVASLNAVGDRQEKKELDELDLVEEAIRGSNDPVDYARYSRKALRAYYLMGQNQVRLSFYVGVGAMAFGFIFLVAGLLVQALDTTAMPYLRADQDISIIVVGGGLIIEFIAATFLWIYRTAIVQLNLYYRRQILLHSALLSVAVAKGMEGENFNGALREIITTLVMPGPDGVIPDLPKTDHTPVSVGVD